MPFEIVRNDITKMKVDAIVNAANTALQMGGGVCGAIFKAAGQTDLQAACDALRPIQTGQAVITDGFHLPARHIIHTAGPVYKDGKQGEEELLRSCYLNSLTLAQQNKCESVAFPLISGGIYGYPKDQALAVATAAIREFLQKSDLTVYLVVFDKGAFTLSEKLLGAVSAYIDERYVDEHLSKDRRRKKLHEAEEEAREDAGLPCLERIEPGTVPQEDTAKRRQKPSDATLRVGRELAGPPGSVFSQSSRIDDLIGR
ncbi:macro domain-containing protein, partial [Acetonema longum]